MHFPNNCIKGIPNDDFITNGGTVGANLFYFKEDYRDDGWTEQSINWEDDASVIEFTLKQRKENGDVQFKKGAAIVSRSEIDRLNNRPFIRGLLSYERKPISGNCFHGNILLRAKTPKPTMKLIAAGIALAIERIVPQASA